MIKKNKFNRYRIAVYWKIYVKIDFTTIFDGKECLCYNNFNSNPLLLDENNRPDFIEKGKKEFIIDFVKVK